MKMFTFLVLYFSLFSFFGWIIESLYRTQREKRPINSGFLYGPFIPIYGFGVVLIYLLSIYLNRFHFLTEVAIYTLIATLLEYISSYILEKIFSIKLWDYSEERFNLYGRVCLKFSLFWAILISIYLYFFQSFFVDLINRIDHVAGTILAGVLVVYFAIDTFLSSKIYFVFANVFNYAHDFIRKGFEPADFFSRIKLPFEIKEFLRAMKQFPHLARMWNKKWDEISVDSTSLTAKWIDSFIKKETNKSLMSPESYSDDPGFMKIAGNIINNPEYQKLKDFHHHEHSIYHHNLQVAWLSYKIGKTLNARLDELVRGALLHDFFLYNWRTEKPASGKLHAFEHPVESYHNATKNFGHVTRVEKDIILKHMWPLTIIPPVHLESFIVCTVDKIVATKEFSNEFAANRSKK